MERTLLSLAAVALYLAPVQALPVRATAALQGPNITVSANFASPRVVRGRAIRGTVTVNIPAGYHANANPASESYLIPTSVAVIGPAGVTIGAVSYPRAIMKKFSFSNGKALKVYEGQVAMSFNVTVPANYPGNDLVLNAKVRVQSCDDKTCFAPKTIDTTLRAAVSR
jgi:DsbC/DsbD-like thiol-disulfide interchange protein